MEKTRALRPVMQLKSLKETVGLWLAKGLKDLQIGVPYQQAITKGAKNSLGSLGIPLHFF